MIRADFPMADQVVYLDSAATTLKPTPVIDAITQFYRDEYATIHRGVYELSQKATEAYDVVRVKAQEFLNASSHKEIIFTKGTTEAINLVAHGLDFETGDEIVVSETEHHANIVPWQQTKATLVVARVTDTGELDMADFESKLSNKTKLVAIAHVSNALGTIHPIKTIIQKAKAAGTMVLIDGAQGAPHCAVDVQELGCDFYAFSGHKLYGPTGVGVLYGKATVLESMRPYQCGGDMIESVSFGETTFASIPEKFEAGTPPIAQVIGLGTAIDYVQGVGIDTIAKIEYDLLVEATARLSELSGVRIIGTAPRKAAVISFEIDRVHPHDIGTILDTENIAIRAGHHCAQPTMARFGVPATARASFGCYNRASDIDKLVMGIEKVKQVML